MENRLPLDIQNIIDKDGHLKVAARALSKKYPELAHQLMESYSTTNLNEAIYNLLKGGRPKCLVCGTPTRFVSFTEGYKKTCSLKCSKGLPEVAEKRRQTNLERFGATSWMKVEANKQQVSDTINSKYGVPWAMQSKDIMDKSKETCMEKYGVPHKVQTEEHRQMLIERSQEIHETRVRTYQERYGVNSPLQIRSIQERINRKGFTIRELELEGKIFRLRGFEPEVVNHLHQAHSIPASSIKTSSDDGCPSINYVYEGKNRVYHPDILVDHKGKTALIEVKSTRTIGLHSEKVFNRVQAKLKAASTHHTVWLAVVCRRSKQIVWIKNPHQLDAEELRSLLLSRSVFGVPLAFTH